MAPRQFSPSLRKWEQNGTRVMYHASLFYIPFLDRVMAKIKHMPHAPYAVLAAAAYHVMYVGCASMALDDERRKKKGEMKKNGR